MSSRRERDDRKRSRSWSWSRSRSPPGRHSPGEEAFLPEATSDPRTLDARVFVGSLTPDVTQEMLKKHFSKYGQVKGLLVTRRKFGFVQFTSEEESTKCLADGPFAMVEGRKIDVKPAKIRRPGDEGGDRGAGGGRGWSGGRDGGRPPPRSGAAGVRGARRRDYEDGYYHDAYYRDERGSSRSEAPSGAGYPDDYPEYYRDYYDRYYRDTPVPAPLPPRDYPLPAYPPATLPPPPDPLDPSRPNDLEIVVPNRIQRAFAESIEAELRRVGLLVDILFPPSDVSSSRVLADLTSRRCLFAVTVTPDNEKHRSLTLNILHGTPQEHRNMPVDDALQLIHREFQDYVKQTRRRNCRETLPRDIRNLMLDLLEARNLSMGDLDKLIKYLKDRQNILVDDQIQIKRETSGAS